MNESTQATDVQALADVHAFLVQTLLTEGRCPDRNQVAFALGLSKEQVIARLINLAEIHGLVLHPHEPECWVVHPFSTTPTLHWVEGDKHSWWAPCIWCAFGIATLVGGTVRIHTRIGAEAEPLVIVVDNGKPLSDEIVVHFSIPPRRAWLNVHQHCALVLAFRSTKDARDWCERYGHPFGEAVPLANVAELASIWYRPYTNYSWRKWTVPQAQEIFRQAGLTSAFWELAGEGTY